MPDVTVCVANDLTPSSSPQTRVAALSGGSDGLCVMASAMTTNVLSHVKYTKDSQLVQHKDVSWQLPDYTTLPLVKSRFMSWEYELNSVGWRCFPVAWWAHPCDTRIRGPAGGYARGQWCRTWPDNRRRGRATVPGGGPDGRSRDCTAERLGAAVRHHDAA